MQLTMAHVPEQPSSRASRFMSRTHTSRSSPERIWHASARCPWSDPPPTLATSVASSTGSNSMLDLELIGTSIVHIRPRTCLCMTTATSTTLSGFCHPRQAPSVLYSPSGSWEPRVAHHGSDCHPVGAMDLWDLHLLLSSLHRGNLLLLHNRDIHQSVGELDLNLNTPSLLGTTWAAGTCLSSHRRAL